MIIDVKTVQELQQQVTHNECVAVIVHAPWCMPCERLRPALTRLARVDDGVVWCAIDIDAAPEVATHLSVTTVPTVLIYRDGHMVRTIISPRSAQQVGREIAQVRDSE